MNSYQHALTALAMAACQWATAQTPPSPAPKVLSSPPDASASVPMLANVPARKSDAENDAPRTDEPRFIRGNDQLIAPSKPVAPVTGGASAFNFEETPVADVVRIVLGDILRADYVLYPPLSGTVTLSTREAVAPEQALYLLESALQANGLVVVRDGRGTFHVGRPDAVKGIGSPTRQVVNGTMPAGYGVIVVPLQYIGATEMASILRPLVPAEGLVRVDSLRNLLILAGTRTQADGWLDLVRTFDVDLLKGMSVGVFPLKYASVKEVESALRLMSPGAAAAPGSSATGSGANNRASTAGNNSAATASAVENPLQGALRIMPIERLNSILVVTPRAAYLDEVRQWIERFDRPSDNSAEPQLFVYPVQNGSASHLASVLNGIFGGQSAGTNSSSSSGVAPRLGQSSATSTAVGAGNLGGIGATGLQSNSSSANGGSRSGRSTPGNVTAVNLGDGIRVVADELSNAVLIYGSRADYNRIEAALKRLDLPPTQVLIEASIIEVTLTDELNYGVQWLFNDNSRNGLSGTGVLSGSSNGVLGGAQAGFSYTLRNPLGNVRAILNALATKTNLNVISSPSLMVLDNHTANISVGTQQPIRTAETIGLGGVTSNSIQFKDTGVSLAVTPSVNAGDMVTMDINQAVTDVGPVDAGNTGQVTFNQRQISSKVAVRSGETLVLGGLIRDTNTAAGNGVPGLHDLPLIGVLFGTKTKKVNRTELLVVITPRVVRSDQGLREVSQELRDRMRGLSRASQGGLLGSKSSD